MFYLNLIKIQCHVTFFHFLVSHEIFHGPKLCDLAMMYGSHTCVCMSVVFTQPGDKFAYYMDSQSG
jgi:hypothetical protein